MNTVLPYRSLFSFNISHLMHAGHTLQKVYYILLCVYTIFIHFFPESAVTTWPWFYLPFIFLSLNSQHLEKVLITPCFLKHSLLFNFLIPTLSWVSQIPFCLLIFTLPFDDCIHFPDFDYKLAKVYSWTIDMQLDNSTQISYWQHIYILLKTGCFLCTPDLCYVLLWHHEHDLWLLYN